MGKQAVEANGQADLLYLSWFKCSIGERLCQATRTLRVGVKILESQFLTFSPICGKARALHGAYWHNRFGAVRSHGCVNLSVGDARWIFDWAEEGDWVYVWDPSGEIPTDPAMYGDGGA